MSENDKKTVGPTFETSAAPSANTIPSDPATLRAQAYAEMERGLTPAQARELRRFEVVDVESEEQLREVWYPLLTEIFTDPTDLEPLEMLIDRYRDSARNRFTLLRDKETGEWAGLRLLQTESESPGYMYCPWGGVRESYRSRNIYPLMAKLTLAEMRANGVFCALADIEDPARVAVAYPEDPEGAVRIAAGRVNFFRREMKYYVVDDPEVPYIRVPSEEGKEKEIQAYDLLAFGLLDPKAEKASEIFNADRTAITKSAYRDFFIKLAQIQYAGLSDTQLREEYPAIDQFLEKLDAYPHNWIKVSNKLMKSRSHQADPIEMTSLRTGQTITNVETLDVSAA